MLKTYWCVYKCGTMELKIECQANAGFHARILCDKVLNDAVKDSSAWTFSHGGNQ